MEPAELNRRFSDFYVVASEVLRDVSDITVQQVKHWIVTPFLVSLGWDPHDKHQVFLDFPVKKGSEHADYALLDEKGDARLIIDVRTPTDSATEPERAVELARAAEAPLALVTNGKEFSLWYLGNGDAPTPLSVLALKDLPANSDALLGLAADFRLSETGVNQLRRSAIRMAVFQLLEENSEKTFDALTSWVKTQIAPGGWDDTTEQAVREATLSWLAEEHHLLPEFAGVEDGRKAHVLRSTTPTDWEPFPRGPPGTFVYRFDTSKTLDLRQTPKEVRDALRVQGLKTTTATSFGGFYDSLRNRAGLARVS